MLLHCNNTSRFQLVYYCISFFFFFYRREKTTKLCQVFNTTHSLMLHPSWIIPSDNMLVDLLRVTDGYWNHVTVLSQCCPAQPKCFTITSPAPLGDVNPKTLRGRDGRDVDRATRGTPIGRRLGILVFNEEVLLCYSKNGAKFNPLPLQSIY